MKVTEVYAVLSDWGSKEFNMKHADSLSASHTVDTTLPAGIFLCLSFSQTLSVSPVHPTVPCCGCFICLSESMRPPPPGGWQGETGNRFRRGGHEKATGGEQRTVTLCSSLCVGVCVWECWTVTPSLTACRGANRSNRGPFTMSGSHWKKSSHTDASCSNRRENIYVR